VHGWLGLFLGGLFAVLGLSGSLLVFHRDIERALAPPAADVAVASIEAILAAVSGKGPSGARASFYEAPPVAGHPAMVHMRREGEPSWRVFVDPASAAVLGIEARERTVFHWVYIFHDRLLLPHDYGDTVVAVLGIALMVSAGSGLYLWWPRRGQRGPTFLPSRGVGQVRRMLELHKSVGIWACVVLLVLAVSGVYLARPRWVEPLVALALPFETPGRIAGGPLGDAALIGTDRAATIARERFPGAVLVMVGLPNAKDRAYRVFLRQSLDLREFGNTTVWVDGVNGDILAVREPGIAPAGNWLLMWMFPLHNGEALGLGGRILACVVGLCPTALLVTGVLIRRNKRRARRGVEEMRRAALAGRR
jgi:uncharacterized iron-regulated membrane protein